MVVKWSHFTLMIRVLIPLMSTILLNKIGWKEWKWGWEWPIKKIYSSCQCLSDPIRTGLPDWLRYWTKTRLVRVAFNPMCDEHLPCKKIEHRLSNLLAQVSRYEIHFCKHEGKERKLKNSSREDVSKKFEKCQKTKKSSKCVLSFPLKESDV